MLRFEQERSAKEIEINALLNRAPDTRIDLPEEMPTGDLPATLDQMLAAARANAPALAIEQKQVQRSELAANLARKDYYPDYTVSGGYFNQGGMPPMWQFRVDFKMPAWFWSKQRAAVNEQEFAASEARHNYESTGVDLDARIREEYTLAATSRKLIDLYEKSVIPEARLALESSMASYETGALDFLALYSNFMNVVDYELRYHEEIMQFHIALARLRGDDRHGDEAVKKVAIVFLAAAAWGAGYGYGRWYAKPTAAAAQRKPLYWVDPMHPWYKSDRPGSRPIAACNWWRSIPATKPNTRSAAPAWCRSRPRSSS